MTRRTPRPSIATLSAVFDDPVRARAILRMTRAELEALPCMAARPAPWHPHPTHYLRLLALDDLDAGLFGVECIHTTSGDEFAEYLNTGDSYAPTVIHWRGHYRVQCVADFIDAVRATFV